MSAGSAKALSLIEDGELRLLDTRHDAHGNLHTRYQQIYKGLPIWGRHITLHQRNNNRYHATGKLARGLKRELIDFSSYAKAAFSYLVPSNTDSYVDIALRWLNYKFGLPVSSWAIQNT